MKPLLIALLAIGLFSGCSTVSSRIKKDPGAYSSLSPRDQQLVRTGHVREGLSPAAVYLAWGKADTIRRGSRQGRPYEAWTYLATESSPRSVFYGASYYGPGYGGYGGYGGVYGRFGRGGYAPYGGLYGDDDSIRFYPYRTAIFERGRLTAWSDEQ